MNVQSRSSQGLDDVERESFLRNINSESISKAQRHGKWSYTLLSRKTKIAAVACALLIVLLPVASVLYDSYSASLRHPRLHSPSLPEKIVHEGQSKPSEVKETEKDNDAGHKVASDVERNQTGEIGASEIKEKKKAKEEPTVVVHEESDKIKEGKSADELENKSKQDKGSSRSDDDQSEVNTEEVEDKKGKAGEGEESGSDDETRESGKTKDGEFGETVAESPLPSQLATEEEKKEPQKPSKLPKWVQDHFVDNSTEATRRPKLSKKCNLWEGKWVYDESYPLWDWNTCPFGDDVFNCGLLGRTDMNFTKLRWQPHGCTIPRFDAAAFRQRMRGRRMAIVGDSLGRNQFVSLLCMAARGADPSKIYERQGGRISKSQLSVVYVFEEYNFTLEYFRSPWLVLNKRAPLNAPEPPKNPYNVTKVSTILALDEIDSSWRGHVETADFVLFNTGHWINEAKLTRSGVFFTIEGTFHFSLTMQMAFHRIVRTVADWAEGLKDPRPSVAFRGYAPVHFQLGDWNTGGRCTSLEPRWKQSEAEDLYFTPMAQEVISNMRRPMAFLNILRLSALRNDAHIGKMRNSSIYDCSHWCLPGVPDAWNELWIAQLMADKVAPFDK